MSDLMCYILVYLSLTFIIVLSVISNDHYERHKRQYSNEDYCYLFFVWPIVVIVYILYGITYLLNLTVNKFTELW